MRYVMLILMLCLCGFPRLQRIQPEVHSFKVQQLSMRSAFHNFALAHHENDVTINDRLQAMRNRDAGAPGASSVQCILHHLFAFHVQR